MGQTRFARFTRCREQVLLRSPFVHFNLPRYNGMSKGATTWHWHPVRSAQQTLLYKFVVFVFAQKRRSQRQHLHQNVYMPGPVGCIESFCSAPLRPQCVSAAVQSSFPLRTFVPLIWTISTADPCYGYPLRSRDTCFVSYVTYRSHAVPANNLLAVICSCCCNIPLCCVEFTFDWSSQSMQQREAQVLTWPNYGNSIDRNTHTWMMWICLYLLSLQCYLV